MVVAVFFHLSFAVWIYGSNSVLQSDSFSVTDITNAFGVTGVTAGVVGGNHSQDITDSVLAFDTWITGSNQTEVASLFSRFTR